MPIVRYMFGREHIPIPPSQVVELVKERIGLHQDARGFSLFEVFGQLERNMLPGEKVADAMFKWEKYARSTHSPKSLKLTYKVNEWTRACCITLWPQHSNYNYIICLPS